jgi:hypothetical protein
MTLPLPSTGGFPISETIKFPGITSYTLVGYISGKYTHITPGAHFDYVKGNNWENLCSRIQNLLKEHKDEVKVAEILHSEKYD